MLEKTQNGFTACSTTWSKMIRQYYHNFHKKKNNNTNMSGIPHPPPAPAQVLNSVLPFSPSFPSSPSSPTSPSPPLHLPLLSYLPSPPPLPPSLPLSPTSLPTSLPYLPPYLSPLLCPSPSPPLPPSPSSPLLSSIAIGNPYDYSRTGLARMWGWIGGIPWILTLMIILDIPQVLQTKTKIANTRTTVMPSLRPRHNDGHLD